MTEATPLSPDSISQSNRRLAVRTPSTQQACCHFAVADEIQGSLASVRDLSKAGVSLVLGRSFAVGEQIVIELPSGPLCARVVRVVDLNDGTWVVGCWFGRLLSDDEFHALL